MVTSPGSPSFTQSHRGRSFQLRVLYAGAYGSGLFKSTDAGMSWAAINNGLQPSADGKLYPLNVWPDPNFPGVVFAAINTGLARTSDGGATWVYPPPSPYVFGLSFDPLLPGVIYVASSPGGLRSVDDGRSWTTLTALPGEYSPQAILADPVHKGVLYAGASSGLFVSSDSGVSWSSRLSEPVTSLAADPFIGSIYAVVNGYWVVVSRDEFKTTTRVGPPALNNITQLLATRSHVFVATEGATDVFVMKLDAQGKVVYSTYFGGAGSDYANDLAVDGSGAVYVTGNTRSLDFPVTANAYATVAPATPGAGFLFKLNPDGSLAYSTYFADARSIPNAVAVDGSGAAYLAGTSIYGGLPVTAGAYQTAFRASSAFSILGPGPPAPTNAFLTKLNASGSALEFSTYIGYEQESATAIVLDASGTSYLAGGGILYRMSHDGSSLLSSTYLPGTVRALALDQKGHLYAAGETAESYPTTSGAFERSQPAGSNMAFVTELEGSLRNIIASTLLSGANAPIGAQALAIAGNGDIIVGGYSDSPAFPLLDPVQQSFSAQAGFVMGLSPDLTHLIFSTNAGDTRTFSVSALAAQLDGSISFAGDAPGSSQQAFFANLVPGSARLPRLDKVVNAASLLALPLSPGEAIQVRGEGFSSPVEVSLGDRQISSTSVDTHTIAAVVPVDFAAQGATSVSVVANGVVSNPVLVPLAPASPGIYAFDGSGMGQGYILNADGTRNSPSNPAREGSAITIFATGVGSLSFSGPYAVTAGTVSVFINGYYADGSAAIDGPVAGLPGDVYQISVYVPKPQVSGVAGAYQAVLNLTIEGASSQSGISLWLTPVL